VDHLFFYQKHVSEFEIQFIVREGDNVITYDIYKVNDEWFLVSEIYVKILTPIEYSRMDKEVDDSFISFDFINNLFKELSPLLKDRKFQIRDRTFYHPTKSIPTAYSNVSRAPEPVLLSKSYNVHEVVFETITEDLSWGGIYPPILNLYWDLGIVPLEDEYFLLSCGFSQRDESGVNRSTLMVDGRENLLPVIKDMIQNYDLL
jgi:hypothetical protein